MAHHEAVPTAPSNISSSHGRRLRASSHGATSRVDRCCISYGEICPPPVASFSASCIVVTCLTFCFWNIYPAQLIPLEFRSKTAAALEGADSPIVSESLCMSAADVISKHSGEYGCIAFAIRRPGKIQYIAVRCGELSCTLYLTTLILY